MGRGSWRARGAGLGPGGVRLWGTRGVLAGAVGAESDGTRSGELPGCGPIAPPLAADWLPLPSRATAAEGRGDGGRGRFGAFGAGEPGTGDPGDP